MTKRLPHETGCKICGEKVSTRGLCDTHYRRFMAKLKTIGESQGSAAAEQFESDCLADGWLLPKTKGGRPKDADPFDEIAAKVIAEFARDIPAAVAREEAREAKANVKKRATKKSDRKAE